MKTVMFYIGAVYGGGAEKVMAYLANGFAKNGYKSILVTSFKTDNDYRISEDVIRIVTDKENEKKSFLSSNINRIKILRKSCRKYEPEVLISFICEQNFRSIIATVGLKTKTIISIRANPEREYAGIIKKVLAKIILPLANGCVFQTEQAKNWFPPKLQQKAEIIKNPVDSEFFANERNPEIGKIVAVGRLYPVKNYSMLIDAFQKVKEKLPFAKLEIYGEGYLKEELQAKINEMNLSESVFLKGRTENVAKVLSGADVYVLASDSEGMPNALLEALASGVACISTNCPVGGPGELIQDGENGMLVSVGDSDSMANKLYTLLNDNVMKKRMGDEARKRAQEFHEDVVIHQWIDYTKNIASGSNA